MRHPRRTQRERFRIRLEEWQAPCYKDDIMERFFRLNAQRILGL